MDGYFQTKKQIGGNSVEHEHVQLTFVNCAARCTTPFLAAKVRCEVFRSLKPRLCLNTRLCLKIRKNAKKEIVGLRVGRL